LKDKQVKIVALINLLTGSKISIEDFAKKANPENLMCDDDSTSHYHYKDIDLKSDINHGSRNMNVTRNPDHDFVPLQPKVLTKTESYKEMKIEGEDDTPIQHNIFEKKHIQVDKYSEPI
jgi:hypothetical protein